MNNRGNITAVGLGPGDAQFITMKGYKALKNADVIFYPASVVEGKIVDSFSLRILDELDVGTPLVPMHLPMKATDRMQYYQACFEQLKEPYDKGLQVAVVSEGDVLFYSTFGYLWQLIREAGWKCSVIPGIPAFVAASQHGPRALIEGDETLQVIPCPENLDELQLHIQGCDTLVVMKLSRGKGWHRFIEDLAIPFTYVEYVGTKEQYITCDKVDLLVRQIPYFSMLILYNEANKRKH
jgi:precorrin-2/cobalt-factor-2 C20-methyltransferase